MPSGQDRSLHALVRVLVEEWGHSKVQKAVDAMAEGEASGDASAQKAAKKPKGAKPRLTARELVSRLDTTQARKEVLLAVADQFDSREFMPSVADVRNFLESRGFDARAVRDRADAFRAILRVLVIMSDDRLAKLARESVRAGPSQLGPLSDAITRNASRPRSSFSDDVVDPSGESVGDRKDRSRG